MFGNDLLIRRSGLLTPKIMRRLVHLLRSMRLTCDDGSIIINYSDGGATIRANRRGGLLKFDHPWRLSTFTTDTDTIGVRVRTSIIYGDLDDGVSGVPVIGSTSLDNDPAPYFDLGEEPSDGTYAFYIKVITDCDSCTVLETPEIIMTSPGDPAPEPVLKVPSEDPDDPEDETCVDGEDYRTIGSIVVTDGVPGEPIQQMFSNVQLMCCYETLNFLPVA